MRSPGRLALPLLLTLTACSPLPAEETLDAARSLFLNLANRLFIKGLDVAAPPAGVQAAWAARIEWEQAAGCPDWGNVSLGFRADAATGYAFDLLAESVTGPAGVNVYLTEADGDRWVENWSLADRLGKGWLHVDLQGEGLRLWQFGNGIRQPDTIGGITFEPYGKGSSAVFRIANLEIHTRAGLGEILPLMADNDCPPPTSAAPAIRLPDEPRCYMGTSLSWLAKPQGREFVEQLRKLVPNLGVAATASSWRPEWRDVIQRARADGIDVRVQNGGIAGMAGLITQAHAWGVDPQGRSRNTTPGFGDGMHGVSYCHPATREAVRRLMAAMRGIGVLDYEQIDYVWPWYGGPWGYGEWDTQAFRNDLQELDEGLRLASGRTMRFWDYLAAYGTTKPRPVDLGLDSWEAFDPKAQPGLPEDAARRRGFVFTALTHYEWLRFAQAMGVEARSWGGRFLGTLNPEDVSNGGDYLFWNRLADTGTEYLERFGNPDATEYWRHYLPYLRQEATRAGKRLGVIYEVGVGGHGKPYLDPQVAYCQSYDCAASGGFDDLQNEWMDEGDWTASQEGYHRDRLQQWLATAYGFGQAKTDGAVLPARKVLAIGLRCVVHAIGFTPSYQLTTGALNDLNLDCDYADLTMDPADWERYQVLIYTPWESSRAHLEALPRWLDVKPGRVLITHGAVPTRIAGGLGYSPSAEVGDGSLGNLLSLGAISAGDPVEGTVGTVAADLSAVLRPGETVRLPGKLFATERGEKLADLGGKPLVARAQRANGSVVYYLNYAAGQPETRDLDRKLLGRLLTLADCQPTVLQGEGVTCHPFDVAGGKAVVLWSRDACARFRFEYRSDIEQRVKYEDPSVDLSLRLALPDGAYRVYDFWSGGEEVQTVRGGGLPLTLKGRSCTLVYCGADTPAWRAHLGRLRRSPRPGQDRP